MIRPSYSLKLARTKLRSKRGVLITSVIVSSLLFAALIAGVIVFNGAQKSAEMFIKKSGNDQYLVKASPVIPADATSFPSDLTLENIKEIKKFEAKYYTNLEAKYKSLNLDYDKSTEVSALEPAAWKPASLPDELRVMINVQSPVTSALLAEKFTKYTNTATNKLTDLKVIGAKYGASGYYEDTPALLPAIPNSRLIQDGKEDFGKSELKAGDMSTYGYYTNAIYNSGYSFSDERLLERYLLDYDKSALKGIPVVVSAQEAATLFGKQFNIGEEPTEASAKMQWLATLQDKLNGYTYQVCYRNSAEQAMLEKIQRDYADIQSNKDSQDFVKPTLIYKYPTEGCGNIGVEEDTRSLAEKNATIKAEETQKKLGTYAAPEHRLLTFQIVGIANAQPYENFSSNVESYIKSLLVAQNNSITVTIPLQAYEALPQGLKFGDFADLTSQYGSSYEALTSDDFKPRILEFSSIENARAFMTNETCPSLELNCNKKFLADTYGSNYLILDEIGKLFNKVASIAFPVILVLATIIIWFTMSRIMAENRKETAVYRAMGAKRSDITSIYLTYTLLVALRIALASLLLGIGAAYLIDLIYGTQLTNVAVASFGIIEGAPRFSLFDLNSSLLWMIVGSIFIISIIASIQPLVRNVMRAPIRDIREE